MKKVRVGVIGCGHIAQQVHIPNYLENPQSELMAICDSNEDVMAKIAKIYGIKYVFGDYQALLNSGLVQAISVCVPTRLHSQVVIDAAKHGVHVLCEKPLASNMNEANKILEAVSKSGIKFSVGFNLRFLPNHLKVKEYIEKGRIGKPIFARAQLVATGPYGMAEHSRTYETEKRIGCLFDLGSHLADLMLWMFGKPSCVSAFLSTYMQGVKVDDSALVSVKFESGLLGEMSVAWTPIRNYGALEESRKIQIIGTKGVLESDIFGPSFRFYSVNGLSSKLKGKITLVPRKFDPRNPLEALSWSYEKEIEDFIQSIDYDKTPSVTGEEARESLRLILAAYESHNFKRVVSLN